jgi:hypothetical protein
MGPRYAALTSTIPVEPFSPPFHISFHRLSFDGLSLIKEFLPLRQPQFHFGLSIGKIETERDESKSFLLNLSDETPNLLFMEKKFPRPQWIGIKSISMGIWANMSIHKKDLSILNLPVTVTKIGPSLPEGFYLRSQKGNSSFVFILNKIMMPGLLILADQLLAHSFILPKKEV